MRIVFIASLSGKAQYQDRYDQIIHGLQQEGMTVVSEELGNLYEGIMTKQQYGKLPNKQDIRDELLRQSIANSDGVVIETTFESFKVGNEATLAVMYGKPTLCLSLHKVHTSLIAYDKLENAIYNDENLHILLSDFLKRVNHKMFLSKDLQKGPAQPIITTKVSAVVFGDITIDMIVKVDVIPGAQETTEGESVKFGLGGKAVNAAVALSRLGCQTYMVGNVGKDLYGQQAKDELIRQRIDTRFVTDDDYYSTGSAVVLVDRNGHNALTAVSEANNQIKEGAIDRVFSSVASGALEADMIYVNLAMREETARYILEQAKRAGLPAFLHAAPHTRTLTDSMISMTEFISLGQKEAQKYTGIHVENFETANQAALLLRGRGAKNTIINIGSLGSIILQENAEESTYFPVKPIQVLDSTASGDAFRGAFISTYLREKDISKAMRFGSLAGAYASTRFGTSESMPYLTDMPFAKFIYKQYGIKNLIFDYNGVISDDFYLVYDTAMKIFTKYDIARMTFEEFKSAFTYPVDTFYKTYIPGVPFEEINKFYFENYDTDAKPRLFPRAKEVLELLVTDEVPMVIMSAHNKEKLLHELEEFGVAANHVFRRIYADVRDKVRTIEQVLEDQHFNPRETAYIGDTEHDVEAAKKAGVYSIASTYGYKTTEKLARIIPDIYINSIEELKLFI